MPPVAFTEGHQRQGIVLALKNFPVWSKSRESGGGPSQQGQGAEGGAGQRGLLTSRMVFKMGLRTSAVSIVVPGVSGFDSL